MSLLTLPTVLKAFDLWVNNETYAGKCTKVKLPDLKRKLEEMYSGGITRPIKIDVGGEAMDFEFDTSGLDINIIKNYAACAIDGVYLAFMGALETDDSCAVISLEVHVWGRYESLEFGDQEAGKLGTTTSKLAVDRIKIVANGKTLLEDDPRAMKLIVDGVDKYEKRRQALGRF